MIRLSTSSLTFFLVLMVSITGLALNQTAYLDPVEGGALDLLALPQKAVSLVAGRLLSIGTGFADLNSLLEENAQLRRDLNRLQVEIVQAREAQLENETLRNLLDFKAAHRELDLLGGQVVGRIIGGDPTGFLDTIVIDVGQTQGARRDLPVITDRGLVGRVIAAGSQTSRVLLITDPASSVNAMIQRSRATGVVEGTRQGHLLMRFIDQGVSIEPGDIVVTSGLGGNFPRGLPIGQVLRVRQRDIDPFQEAEIRPTVNFGRLELVLVVTDFIPLPRPEDDRLGLEKREPAAAPPQDQDE